jgi:hypothetical protein
MSIIGDRVPTMLSDPEGELLLDLRVFARAVAEEFRTKFFEGFEERRQDYNALLERTHGFDIARDLQPIQPIPAEDNPWPAHASGVKRAKLREVANAADRLLHRAEARWIASGNSDTADSLAGTLALIELLCNRFHAVVRQLRGRHNDRPTLDVADEYDVQDLLHALFQIHFDDIRPEEYTPSYAGGRSRTDFLLKNECVMVEVKKTRPGLSARELGEQLLVDIGRYSAHPDSKVLICFVYDPEGRIANARGVEADLEKRSTEKMRVRVLIRPIGL